MVHGHPVVDADKHFLIDPITRYVLNAEEKKTILMQNDHNSERFSFEIDKIVEGHDMTLCNKVEVHYLNTASASRLQSAGVYEVDDVQIASSDPSKIVFTWLVSENATRYAGPLNFLIKFACVEDAVCTYKWHTDINTSMTIAKGMDNGEAVVEEPYPDILEQWREKLFSNNYAYEDAVANGFEGSLQDWYDAVVGSGNAGAIAQEAKNLAAKAYGPGNAPPYPVTSVNGETGAVKIRRVYSENKNIDTLYAEVKDNDVRLPYVQVNNDDPENKGSFAVYFDSVGNQIFARVQIGDAEPVYTLLYDATYHRPPCHMVPTGGKEGQICAVNADGTISPNARTIASLGTGATYSLNGTTLTITTL